MHNNYLAKNWVLKVILITLISSLGFYILPYISQAALSTCYSWVCIGCQDTPPNPHCGSQSCGPEIYCDVGCVNNCSGGDCSLSFTQCLDAAKTLEDRKTCSDGFSACVETCREGCTKCCSSGCIDNCSANNCGSRCITTTTQPPGSTHTCHWMACSSANPSTCTRQSDTYSADDDCPIDSCSTNSNCSGSLKCGCDTSGGKTCNNSGIGNSCSDASLCPACTQPPTGTGKCGLDSENYLVCKLDGTGTGAPCSTDNDCTCGGCPVGQTNPHNACVSSTCSSVNSCGVNDCTSCPITTPSCSITNFDITPTFRTILLGGSFKASWNTADCTSCTLSCAPGAPGCGIAASGSPVSLSGTNYSIKPTQSGKYSYTLTCISPLTSETRGAGVIPGDKPFSVINFFWRETPAFLKLLIDKLFQH